MLRFEKVRLGVVALLLVSGLNLHAHNPFDGSARMNVRDEDIELTITFGADAARRVLAVSGKSQDEIADLMKPRGPRAHQILPVSIVAHLFTIRNGEELLSARSATLLSDGTEVIFTVIYPRPAAGQLAVLASYFDQIEEMRSGSFIARDENGQQLGAAVLSRATVKASVDLPPKGVNVTPPPSN